MTWYCLSEAVLRRLELRTAAAKALLEDGANLEAPGTDIYKFEAMKMKNVPTWSMWVPKRQVDQQ